MKRKQDGIPSQARLQAAFEDEEFASLRLVTRARLAVIAVVVMWVHIENPLPMALANDVYIVGFLVLTLVPYGLRRIGYIAAWPRFLFPTLDMTLLVVIAVVPNLNEFPPQMLLRFGNELYLFLILTSTVFTYSPRAVMWAGVSGAAVWALGTMWIWAQPGTVTTLATPWGGMTTPQRLAAVLDPYRVNLTMLGRQSLLLIVTAGVLAVAVQRARRLLERQLESERERENLARYFSPNMVEELSQSDEPLRTTRTQNVAVLFSDVMGFTRLSETQPPEIVIELLRELHAGMAKAIFDHEGTLDKFLGDGVMATFGTPRVGRRDASNALRSARAMLEFVEVWSEQRRQRNQPVVTIGVGVHFGPVILGDIGDAQRLEFAVLGDTVNVASRLQQLTRSLGTTLVISAAALDVARADGSLHEQDQAGLVEVGEHEIRGRNEGMRLWKLQLPKQAAAGC